MEHIDCRAGHQVAGKLHRPGTCYRLTRHYPWCLACQTRQRTGQSSLGLRGYQKPSSSTGDPVTFVDGPDPETAVARMRVLRFRVTVNLCLNVAIPWGRTPIVGVAVSAHPAPSNTGSCVRVGTAAVALSVAAALTLVLAVHEAH